jgi:hypothetical protein
MSRLHWKPSQLFVGLALVTGLTACGSDGSSCPEAGFVHVTRGRGSDSVAPDVLSLKMHRIA